jgi:hypothetical protein
MHDEPEYGMIVVPAYHNGIQSQDEINDAGISFVHCEVVEW